MTRLRARLKSDAPAGAAATPDGNTNRLVGTGIEYDLAGNMTRDGATGGGLRTYDGENRMTAAQGAGGTWFRYVYDADGKRVKRNVGTASETWMVYGIDGEPVAEYAAANGVNPTPASPTTEYAYRLGEMLIQADASDCKWLVSDHLGSPRIILGKSGSLADTKRRDFMPFGEDLGAGQFGRTTALGYEASGTPSNPREKFATYERDDETGLDFAQARYYQSKLGRFTSVDPLMASAAPIEPQSWNRYSYVGNRPLSFNDPTGMIWLQSTSTRRIGWYSGDKVPEGYEELKVGTVTAVEKGGGRFKQFEGRHVMLGKDGRVVDMGPIAKPELDFQHGAGTESVSQFLSYTVPAGVTLGLSGTVTLGAAASELAEEILPDVADSVSQEQTSGSGSYLIRFGANPETVEQLAGDAARAEANGFPHGVSTKQVDRVSGSDKKHRSALKAEVEKYFKVQQTGKNPSHHTVHLPNPVTRTTAAQFNRLFKMKK